MSGHTPPSMNFEHSVGAAENAAGVIYNLSEQCLMAHTLRATELYIRNEYRKRFYPIILHVERGVRARWNSKSWAIVTDHNAHIFVDAELEHDQKRVCIAHECYHILEFFRPIKSQRARIEDICDHFANDLCAKHNQFYHTKLAQCQFKHLPINSKRG